MTLREFAWPDRWFPPLVRIRTDCESVLNRVFRRPVVDVRIVFGYKDARPARFVGDRYERLALLATLLGHCQGDRFDCGFHRSRSDADLLIKKVWGPDRRIYRVEVRLVNSSVGPDDDENRTDSWQRWQSDYAQSQFLEGLKDADVVFYNGHSRDGGGPDFSPPMLRADHHVFYLAYQNQRLGVRNMSRALAESKSPPAVVGLFSCVSNNLVSPAIKRKKKTRWITTRHLVYYADALDSMRDSLSNLLGLRCMDDIT
jgi:hypothetical protein